MTLPKPAPPFYRPVAADGTMRRCFGCGQLGLAGRMWFVRVSNEHKGLYHKSCVDEDWLKSATFYPVLV